ncbi:WXG100 family type VII secretion target [Mycolicibacterium boenickei]
MGFAALDVHVDFDSKLESIAYLSRGFSMANDLRVDLPSVQAAAEKIETAADGLRAAHGAVHDRITAAQSGWIGASGTALTTATGKWEEESAARYTELIGHAADYRSAVASYGATDESEAYDVEAAAAAMKL